MNAMLQYLANDEPAVRLPTFPWQYKGQGSSPHGVSPAARAPRADSSEDQFASWRGTHDASSQRDQEFLELLVAYRASGGLARTHEVIGSCKRRDGCDTGQLARWIVTRQIISIHWQDQTWIPWFQFDPILGQPRSPIGQIARELCSVLDDWGIAHWFVQPNACLDDSIPAENLTSRPADLLKAARACHFLVKG